MTGQYEIVYDLSIAAIFNDIERAPKIYISRSGRYSTLNMSRYKIDKFMQSQSCPWVGSTHGLGWVGLGWVEIF